MDSPLLYL